MPWGEREREGEEGERGKGEREGRKEMVVSYGNEKERLLLFGLKESNVSTAT